MRSKLVETKKCSSSRRKIKSKKNVDYETIKFNSHLGGMNFMVDDEMGNDRLMKWKRLFYIRYYLHLGNKSNINIAYTSYINEEGKDIEEKYKIEADDISVSISIYHNKNRILIQGPNKKEWIRNEFERLRTIIDSSITPEDIEEKYRESFKLDENDINYATDDVENDENEIDSIADAMVKEVLDKIKKDYEDNKKRKQKRKSIKPRNNENKIRSKSETSQIENNKIAIDNIQKYLIQLQDKTDSKVEEMKEMMKMMKNTYMIELDEIKNLKSELELKNSELNVKIKSLEENIIVLKNETNRIKEENVKGKEQEKSNFNHHENERITQLKDMIESVKTESGNEIKKIKEENDLAIKFAHHQLECNKKKETAKKKDDDHVKVKIMRNEENIKSMKSKMLSIEEKMTKNGTNTKEVKSDIKYDSNPVTNENKEVKKNINSEVIILMDSNRKYIDEQKFWRGHTCTKMVAGCINECRKVISSNNFRNAKHIYINIGTNDIEKPTNIDDISNNLINLAKTLQKQYPHAKIYLSEIPIRKDFYDQRRVEVNKFLRKSLPESIDYISHKNITQEMLYDNKHIKRDCIRLMVKNMKDSLRRGLLQNFESPKKTEDKKITTQSKLVSSIMQIFNEYREIV